MLDSEELQETRTDGIVLLSIKDEVQTSAIDPCSFLQEIRKGELCTVEYFSSPGLGSNCFTGT
jgi:hypothetical protein